MEIEDILELKALAENATQGEWKFIQYGKSGKSLVVESEHFHDYNILKTTDDWPPSYEDARYIEGLCPENVLKLIEVIESQRKEITMLQVSGEPSRRSRRKMDALARENSKLKLIIREATRMLKS